MSGGRPFLLIQGRVHPSRLDAFRRWYRTEHVPRVLAIPGIVEHRALCWGPGAPADAPNVMSAFVFSNESAIEQGLSSPEAQRARRDWERWTGEIHELSIQIYGRLDARTSQRYLN